MKRMKRIELVLENGAKLAKRAGAALVLVASVLFLGRSLYANWQELRDYHWHFDLPYLLWAAGALLLAFVSNVGGWALIVGHLGGPRSFRKNAEIYCLAAHGKRLPGLVWYVAGRAYLYERESVPISLVVQGSAWEMVLQLLSGLITYAAFLPLYPRGQYDSFNYLLLTAVPLFLLTLSPSLFRWLLRQLKHGQWEEKIIPVNWRDRALWFAVYLLGWLAGGAILYFLAGAVSSVSPALLPACWGFVALSGIISTLTFFLPGGVGVREVSLSLLLSSYIPLPVAVALAVLFRIWILVGETILLTLFWSVTKSRLWEVFTRLTQKDY
jgi:uncharacterized membrane protein YbhN (UPF0104 family)